jgi:hypothetical protein
VNMTPLCETCGAESDEPHEDWCEERRDAEFGEMDTEASDCSRQRESW